MKKSNCPSQPTIPALPYELWAHIAGFLSTEDLLKSCFVSPALLDIAMKERYREVRIYHLGDLETRRCLLALSPTAALYVRSLNLRPQMFSRFTPKLPHIGGLFLEKVLLPIMKWNKRSSNPPTSVAGMLLLHRISQMKNIDSILVGCHHLDDWRGFTKATNFLRTAFVHAPHLRTLTLDIPLQCTKTAFSNIPQLPILEDLRLLLHFAGHGPVFSFATTFPMIAAFINQQASTLTSLSIKTHKIDSTAVIRDVQYLPALKAVTIEDAIERYESQSSTPHAEFLEKHSVQIEKLRLRFYGPSENRRFLQPDPHTLFSYSVFQIQFPSLTHLDLGLCQTKQNAQESLRLHLPRYLSKFRSTLIHLALFDHLLTFSQIEAVVSVLSGAGTKLRSLELQTYFLSCDLLDLLSRSLSELHELDLMFNSIRKKDAGVWTPRDYWYFTQEEGDQFTQALLSRRYTQWRLRHLRVSPLYYCAGKWNEIRQLLVASLPGVATFNGNSGSDFIAIPDYTKL